MTAECVGDESALRHTPNRAPAGSPSFFIDESPPLSALVVDRARVGAVRHPHAGAGGGDGVPRRAAKAPASRSPGRSAPAPSTRRPSRSATSRSPTLATMVHFMDRRERQLHRGDAPEAARAARLDRGTSAAGATVVMQTLAGGRRAADGRAHRRRLGPVPARPADGQRTRRPAEGRVGATRRCARPLLAALPVAGVNGTLQRPSAQAAGARPCRWRRRARRTSRRRCPAMSATVRVRGDAERPSAVVLVGPPRRKTASRRSWPAPTSQELRPGRLRTSSGTSVPSAPSSASSSRAPRRRSARRLPRDRVRRPSRPLPRARRPLRRA